MYHKERLDTILALVEERGYVTVKYLIENLHYSKATVNRDLNTLSQMGKLKRTWGGAEPVEVREIPLMWRYEYGKPIKKRIAKRACELVADGDTLFIDGSTTAQYMGEYLIEKKSIRVLTNNMALAAFLAERGVYTTVLGGHVLEAPYMLAGPDTVEAAAKYRADKCFFSSRDVSESGEMSYADDIYYSMHRTMMRNSEQVIYLVDSEKIGRRGGRVVLGDFSLVDTVISDHSFTKQTKDRFPDVAFLKVES